MIELRIGDPRWKTFLERHEHRIYHHPKFKKFIEEAFGLDYRILANDDVKCIVPVVEIHSRLFGSRLLSSAFIEYGGFAGEKNMIPDLLSELRVYGSDLDYLEIRGDDSSFDDVLSKHLKKAVLFKRFLLPLENSEVVWKNIQKSKRKAIKKSLKMVEVRELGLGDVHEFYELYVRNMKSFGSPPYSKKYFSAFIRHLGGAGFGKILGGFVNGTLVAGLVGFTYRERIHILIAVSDPRFQEFRPNDAVHWAFIRFGLDNGFSMFDFGRVREESGQFEYKRKWGGKCLDLPSYFDLWKRDAIPHVDVNSPKMKVFVETWKKLPLPFAKISGMFLRKRLGI